MRALASSAFYKGGVFEEQRWLTYPNQITYQADYRRKSQQRPTTSGMRICLWLIAQPNSKPQQQPTTKHNPLLKA